MLKILKGKGESMTKTMYKYGAIAALTLAVLFSAWSWHTAEVSKAVTAAKASVEQTYRVSIDEQRKRLVARSEASERELKKQLTNNSRSKDAEIKKLNTDVASLRSSLQSRPERTADSTTSVPNSTGESSTKAGATGLQLSRPDAEFLAGFSGFSAELQAELRACIKDYEDVKNQINNFKIKLDK